MKPTPPAVPARAADERLPAKLGRAESGSLRAQARVPWRVLLAPLRDPFLRVRYFVLGTILWGWAKFFLPLVIPWAAGRIIDHTLKDVHLTPAEANAELGWITLLCTLAVIGIGIASYYRHVYAVRTIALVQHRLRRRLFDHVQRLSMAFFQRHHSGSLGARVSSDINATGQLFDRGIIQYALDAVFVAVCTAVLLAVDWRLTLVAYGVLLLNGFFLWRYAPRIRRQQKAVQESQSAVTGKAAEYFAAISLVKAYAGEREAGSEFEERSRVVRDMQMENAVFQGRFHGLSFAVLQVSTIVVLIFGAYLIINHPSALTIGGLTAFLLYLGSVNGALQRMIDGINQLQEGLAALERIGDLLRVLPTPAEDPAALAPPLHGEIAFTAVSFAYPAARVVGPDGEALPPNRPALSHFNFTFRQGRTYALVGTSGSGKSTLCQLMLRFYDPDAGSIAIDGHDLRRIQQGHYRQNVAVVLQDPVLFSTSVRDNIDFAIEGASMAAVETAARAAQAHDFITALPEGYDTRLGERGVSLSGGQRQRIAIARALMRDPKLLILDEATSALDTVTEREIQRIIDGQRGARTVVIIAHRLSTIRNVDEVLVLDQGQLIEHGSFAELIARDGAFARLAANQVEGSIGAR